MNHFGIFSVFSGAIDAVGEVFGRKPDKAKQRREWVHFAIASVVLLILSIIMIILAFHQQYFAL